MRSLLLALAVGLAFATVDEDSYQPSKEYVYRYEAQLSTGSRHSSKLWSGLRLTANLHLQFNNRFNVSCMFTDVSLYKMDKFVEERSPSFNVMPEEQLNEGIELDTAQMAKQLQSPFAMVWISGNVLKVILPDTEPLWSANIKRGAISVFEVNLNQRNPVSPLPDESSTINAFQQGWTVYESTPLGYCLTTYSAEPGPSGYYYIIKTRDYALCYEKQPIFHVFNNFRSIPTWDKHQSEFGKTLQMSGEFAYTLRGDKKNFIILTAIGESKIVFSPYNDAEGHVQTSVNQTLTLLNAYAIPETASIPQVPAGNARRQSVRMSLPHDSIESADDIGYSLIDEDPQQVANPFSVWSKDKMLKMTKLVAEDNAEYPSETGLLMMQTLLEMIQQSPKETLQDLFQSSKLLTNNWNATVAPLMMSNLFHLLSVAGTTPAADVVLDACIEDPTLISNCTPAISMIGIFAPPSARIITKLFKLSRQPTQYTSKSLVAACYLAAGSIMGRAEQRYRYMLGKGKESIASIGQVLTIEKRSVEVRRLRDVQQQVNQAIQKMTSKHQSVSSMFLQMLKSINSDMADQDIKSSVQNPHSKLYPNSIWWTMVQLKSARNAHLPLSFPYLVDTMQNVHSPPIVRISAIQALDKFSTMHTEIWQKMDQVLKNPLELPAVRIQAFRTMLNVRAPKHVLVKVAGSLRYEKSQQVACYIWSVFNKLGNSSFPPYKELAFNLTWARPYAAPVACGLQDSSYYHAAYGPSHKLSALTELSYTQSPEFITQADLSLSFDLLGSSAKYLQVSFQSQSLEAVIKSLGAKGWWNKLGSLFDMTRKPRSLDASSEIDKIWASLGIQPRHVPSVQTILSLQILNNDLKVWDLSDFLQTIVDQGKVFTNIDQNKWSIGQPFDYKKTSFGSSFHTALPTEAGIPVLLNVGIAFSTNVKGDVQASIQPPLFDPASDGQPKNVSVAFYVKPKVMVSVMGKMAADCFTLQAGAAFHATVDINAPFSVNTSFSFQNSVAKFSIFPPSQTEPILKLKVKPFVYSSAVPIVPQAKPIYKSLQPVITSNSASIEQTAFTYGTDVIGYNFTFKGERVSPAVPNAVSSPMVGRHDFALYSTHGSQSPACVSLAVKCFRQPEPSPKGPMPADIESPPPSPYSEFPDLINENISFSQLQLKLKNTIGYPEVAMSSKSQIGFIAVLDSSSPQVERKVCMEATFKKFKNGQFHQAAVIIKRTPIPNYDPHPWQMTMTGESIYPVKQITPKDLISPKYQIDVQKFVKALLKRKGHQVSNIFLNNTLSAITSDIVMRLMPSLDPTIVLDRVVPDYIVSNSPLHILRLKYILKDVLPVSKQIEELRSEMKDAIQIKIRQVLLLSLCNRLQIGQVEILQFLNDLSKSPLVEGGVVSSVQFAVYKLTQGTHDLDEIMQRAINVRLVSPASTFEQQRSAIMQQQLNVARMASNVLPNLIIINPSAPQEALSPQSKPPVPTPYSPPSDDAYGWSSPYGAEVYKQPAPVASPFEAPVAPTTISDLTFDLKKLTTHQLRVIELLQNAVSQQSKAPLEILVPLLNATSFNVTEIDSVFQAQQINDEVVIERLVQASVQHQMIVFLLRKAVYGSGAPLWDGSRFLPSVSSYAAKVQTKQLTERMCMALCQHKEDATIMPVLDVVEKVSLQRIHQVERKLVTLEKKVVTLPNITWPFTASLPDLKVGVSILNQQLAVLSSVRDDLIPRAESPSPAILTKLMSAITVVQKKVSALKAAMLAQDAPERLQVIKAFEDLEDSSMALRLGLSPLFEKYSKDSPIDQEEPILPANKYPISQSLVEVEEIRHQQEELKRTIQSYLFQPQTPPADTITRVLQYLTDKTQEILTKLKSEQPRVKLAIDSASPLWQFSLYSQFFEALNEQKDLYTTLQEQIQLYDRPGLSLAEYITQVTSELQDIEQLLSIQKLMNLSPSPRSPASPSASSPDSDPYGGAAGMGVNPYSSPYFNAGAGAPYSDPAGPSPYSAQDLYVYKPGQPKPKPVPQSVFNNQLVKQKLFAPRGVFIVWNTTYGCPSGVQRNFKFQIIATKSVEQLLWESAQASPLTRDALVDYAVSSTLQDTEKIEKIGKELFWRLNSYNHLHLHVTGKPEDVPSCLSMMWRKWLQWARHKLYSRTTVTDPLPFVQASGNPQFMVDLSPTMHAMNVFMMEQRETTVMRNVPLPQWLKALYPFHNAASIPYYAWKVFTNGKIPGTCSIYKQNVKTNDGAIYRLYNNNVPNSKSCETLLAADCSPDKAFAITTAPGNTSYPTQALRILAEGHEIKLIPDIVQEHVIVDGQERVLMPGISIVFYKGSSGRSVSVVISREPGYVMVQLPLVGLVIHYKSTHIDIDMSIVYKSTLCGLCGNYDFQKTVELQGPDMKPHVEVETFLQSYKIPTDTCPVPTPRSFPGPPVYHPKGANSFKDESGLDRNKDIFRSSEDGDDDDDENSDAPDVESGIPLQPSKSKVDPKDRKRQKEQQGKKDNKDQTDKKDQKVTQDQCQRMPEKKTLILKKKLGAKDIMCFSDEPVEICENPCRNGPSNNSQEKFSCVDSTSDNDVATELLMKAMDQGVLSMHDLSRAQIKKAYRIRKPKSCQPDRD